MVWIICIFILVFSGCQQKTSERHYTEVVLQAPDQPLPKASEGMDATDPHAGLDMSSMVLPPSVTTSMSGMFSWTTPQGWKQEAGSGMRLATFHLVSDTKAIDCSIVSLGGMAGGLEANLRRWMGQMGIQASRDELATLISSALSTKIKSGQEAKIFDFTTIQSKAKPTDKSMVTVMVSIGDVTLFVKMTGTVNTVKKNKADFLKLVESIESHMPSGDVSTAGNDVSNPHAGLDMSAMAGFMGGGTGNSQNMLVWENPQGWKEEPGTQMRLATFHMASDPKAIDCSIISLAGSAGGLEANLARWAGQLGLQDSQDNLKQLTGSAQSLTTKGGREAMVFDFTVIQSKAAPSDQSMIAAMIAMGQSTVFVKMTGSVESVKQNKNNFLKLVRSISHK